MVATASIKSVGYYPSQVPSNLSDPAELRRYLQEELERIAATFSLLAAGHLDVQHAEPRKPRQGDIRYADGTDWDPGGGEGMYFYNSGGLWVKLG